MSIKRKKLQTIPKYILFVLCLVTCFHDSVMAVWSYSSQENIAICTAEGQQSFPQIVSDGDGGSLIVWEDARDVHFDIYVQKVDNKGNKLWKEEGVPVCTAPEDQIKPRIISDGNGGAIITWHDKRTGVAKYDVYAQRVNADGIPQWDENGLAICNEVNEQNSPCIAEDGSGGAIIVWQDLRTNYADLYAQRVTKDGEFLWEKNGVPVCAAFGLQGSPVVVSDGVGGAIVSWPDFRKSFADIYAQRIDGSGKILWDKSGVVICGARGHESLPVIIGNGAEGAIVTWIDMRNDNNDIFAQQIDGNGNVQWRIDGIPVCTMQGNQNNPVLSSDNAGGALIAWWDARSGKFDVYAQHIDLEGNALWQDDGLPICVESGIQNYVSISSDGFGGALLSWNDNRGGSKFDIYAQRVDADGISKWTGNGIAVSTAHDTQCYSVLVNDGSGGAIIAWQDGRDKERNYWDIYIQKLNGKGELGE